ncbi:MAG TPA: MFS transporter [Spirochaetia bacterium]|nr:MFS transporter [Spirochaetia bacterium]
MNRNRIRSLFAASLLYFAALYVYVPSLPAHIAERTSSLAAVGVVLSMYGLWMAVLRMPVGVITDATGRNKPYLVAGVLLAGVGAVVMVLGRSVGTLAVGRSLTGASAAVWVPMMVVFAGFYPPERTIFATSLLSFAGSFGQMIGTGCTGFLEAHGGHELPFIVAAALALAATLIVLSVRIPRKDAAHRSMVSGRSILAIFGRGDVLIPSFTNALCQFGVWAITFGFMPLLARQLGAGSVVVSLIMSLNIVANTAANLLATMIVRRGGKGIILYGSFVAFAAGAVMAAAARSVAPLFISTVIMGLANGMFFPILLGLSIERVDVFHRSTAMGIHQSVYAIGMFCGPWIGGILADAVGIRMMFVIVAAFSVAAPSALISFGRSVASAADRQQASQGNP